MSIDDYFPSRNSPCKSPHLYFSEVPGWQIQCCPLESLGADRRAREVPRGGWGSDVCLLALSPCPHHPELLPPLVTGVGTLRPRATSWILFWAIPWRRDTGKVSRLSDQHFPRLELHLLVVRSVGTVVELGRHGSPSTPDRTVVVQWDHGTRTNYRAGYQGAHDLLLYDNAQIGAGLGAGLGRGLRHS